MAGSKCKHIGAQREEEGSHVPGKWRYGERFPLTRVLEAATMYATWAPCCPSALRLSRKAVSKDRSKPSDVLSSVALLPPQSQNTAEHTGSHQLEDCVTVEIIKLPHGVWRLVRGICLWSILNTILQLLDKFLRVPYQLSHISSCLSLSC